MKESTIAKSRRIEAALLAGQKLTPAEANRIGNTTDGTRYIRYLREKYPIRSEKVDGELYRRYWIDKEYLAHYKQMSIASFNEAVQSIRITDNN